jgi:hypothetical protein
MLNWIVNYWDNVSIWITNQPTFVEVAFGIGLFYGAMQFIKMILKFLVFVFSPLLTASSHPKKQKDLRPRLRRPKSAPQDDESPPFVFR